MHAKNIHNQFKKGRKWKDFNLKWAIIIMEA